MGFIVNALPKIDLSPIVPKSGKIRTHKCKSCAAQDYTEINYKVYKCNFCGNVYDDGIYQNETKPPFEPPPKLVVELSSNDEILL